MAEVLGHKPGPRWCRQGGVQAVAGNEERSTMSYPGYTSEEVARRGQEIYERDLRSKVETGNEGKFLVVDIETGDYEIDAQDIAATRRVLARNPSAVLHGIRIGHPTAYRIGGRSRVSGL